MLTQTYIHAEPMACSITSAGDEPHRVHRSDSGSVTLRYGHPLGEKLDVDYEINSAGDVTVTDVCVQGVSIKWLIECAKLDYPTDGRRGRAQYDALQAIAYMVEDELRIGL
jgi:hypothetical protein